MTEMTETRADMVEAARKFMLTPKVMETPFEEQRAFLLGKGVSEAEIAEARASIPEQTRSNIQMTYAGPPPPMVYQQNRVVSVAQSVVTIGAISYAGYRFMRSYVLPKFFDIPDPATEELRQLKEQVNDLQSSIKFVMDSVSQTSQQLSTQQTDISRALYSVSSRDVDMSRIETGISTIKSLLLSQHNFAPIATPIVSTIPSWQQAAVPTTSTTTVATASTDGYATPPANFQGSLSSLQNEQELDELETAKDERKTPV